MVKIPKVKVSVIIVSVIGIIGLEAFALYKGIDGALLTTVIGVLGAIAGVAIPTEKIFK